MCKLNLSQETLRAFDFDPAEGNPGDVRQRQADGSLKWVTAPSVFSLPYVGYAVSPQPRNIHFVHVAHGDVLIDENGLVTVRKGGETIETVQLSDAATEIIRAVMQAAHP